MNYDLLCVLATTALLSSCSTISREDLAKDVRQRLRQNIEIELNVPAEELPEELSLYQARKIALRENPQLRQVRARLRQAYSLVEQERSAFMPTVSLASSAVHDYEQGSVVFPRSRDVYSAGLKADWLAFDGSIRKYRVLQAEYGALASSALVEESQRLLLQNVTRVYYSLALLEKQKSIRKASLDLNKILFEDSEKKSAAGVVSDIEVSNFKVRLNNDRLDLVRLNKESSLLKASLSTLLGVPLYSSEINFKIPALKFNFPKEEQLLSDLMGRALENRSGLEALQAQLAVARMAVKEVSGQYSPRVNLFAESGYVRESNPRFSSDDRDTSAGVSLSWEIFEGGRRQALTEASEEEVKSRYEELLLGWNEAIEELVSSVASIKSLKAEVEVLGDNVELNRIIYRKTERLYEEGAVSLTRLNETQTNWLISAQQLAVAQVGLLLEYEDLKSFTGENVRDFQ